MELGIQQQQGMVEEDNSGGEVGQNVGFALDLADRESKKNGDVQSDSQQHLVEVEGKDKGILMLDDSEAMSQVEKRIRNDKKSQEGILVKQKREGRKGLNNIEKGVKVALGEIIQMFLLES